IDPTGHRSTGTSTNVAPLPWLPSVPDALTADPEWGRYLEQRRGDVTALSREVSDRARAWTPVSVPAWARPVIERDPGLAADLAVWRAANGVEDSDRRPTGAPLPAAAAAGAQRALDARVTRLLGDPGSVTARWAPLATSIDERITADAYWPTLAGRLTIADRAGIDIATLACAVGAEAPLPDEQPAAALWWRLSRHLSPAATTATDHSESGTLRPPWTPALADIVGAHAAERVLADPAWPALVAAVTTATSRGRREGWEPEQLLSTAYDLLRSGQPDDAPLRPDELTTALVWRIGMLTDTAAHPAEATAEPFADAPPVDVDRADLADLADAHPALDEAWLASLLQAEPDPVETTGPDDPQGESQDEPSRAHNSDDVRVPDLDTDPGVQIRAALDAAEEARAFVALQEEHFWATAVVGRDRLVELNSIAETFFAAHHHDAWAPGYVRDRLGTDLADQLELRPGYAPDKWTALTEHLRRLGATDEEIVGAGLGTYASTGRVIDRFRDRLVFPIRADSPDGGDTEIHGFIGRRNPAKTDADNAGPKYLNTAETDLFHKGHELYGLSEGTATLRAGAAPVLVEGPMDALAVTLAGGGDYVGIAPLGTAFTDTQADKMRHYLGFDQPGCIVATDNDTAGYQAAQRAYWQLTARNDAPRRLLLPGGKDPAELLQAGGPDALHAALADSPALATSVIADRIAPFQDRLDTVEG
ncbi:MAG: toprim domain-containing protein, partial [Actinobacteria bacterium]|nr:toprim domain-containing protein [Actinomycetota bacterium]